jgi:predicted phosphodiesterase
MWMTLALMVGVIGCANHTPAARQKAVLAPVTQPATQPALAIAAGPYLQMPTETSMTLVWMTSRNCVSRVEYGIASNGPRQVATASQHGLIDANTTLHKVTVSGLSPGRRYFYRVVSTEIVSLQPYKVVYGDSVSGEGSFVTLDAGKPRFSFVVLNDRHEKIEPLKASLGSVKWEGVDLVFLNGDMLNHVETEEQVLRGVVQPCTSYFAQRVPFIYVRGNHETRGGFARSLKAYFPTEGERYYYSFGHGGVRFLILDGGEDKADASVEYSGLVDFERYLTQETEWLRQEVQREEFRKAKFRVVFLHIPPNEKIDPKFIREKYLMDRWVPILNEAKVDLMVSGHTHKYAQVPPQAGKNAFPIIVGGTDTVVRVDVDGSRMTPTTTTSSDRPATNPSVVERK